MSDEESFVILGTSPTPSMECDGLGNSKNSSLLSRSDTLDCRFNSLKSSQLSELQSAREQVILDERKTATPPATPLSIEPQMGKIVSDEQKTPPSALPLTQVEPQMACPIKLNCKKKSVISSEELLTERISSGNIWSRPTQATVIENETSLEDFALKSPLEQQNEKVTGGVIPDMVKTTSNSKEKINCRKSNHTLASSFILGEIGANDLKASVYSQFPSISMEACAEDVVKLQNMLIEYMQLKDTLKKAHNTMQTLYTKSLQWHEEREALDKQSNEQLEKCQKENEMLRKEKEELRANFETQIEALQIAFKTEHEEAIKEVSEKSALVENMRALIIKLEENQAKPSKFAKQNDKNKVDDTFGKFYIKREEHELKVQQLEEELSTALGTNLDLKDLEKQYIEELNYLKVSLTSMEELMKKNRTEIAQLQAIDVERKLEIQELYQKNSELNERIMLLEHANEAYRKDFLMEQEARQTIVKEKQQILQDLLKLQERNQNLQNDYQKLMENYEKKLISSSSNTTTPSLVSAAAAAQTYFSNQKEGMTVLPPLNSTPQPVDYALLHCCPICNKAFKNLSILQGHVNDCIDKN